MSKGLMSSKLNNDNRSSGNNLEKRETRIVNKYNNRRVFDVLAQIKN